MRDLVTLRLQLDLDGMRAQVMRAFSDHELEMEQRIKAEMDRVMNAFDFEEEIKRLVANVSRERFELLVKLEIERQISEKYLPIQNEVIKALNKMEF